MVRSRDTLEAGEGALRLRKLACCAAAFIGVLAQCCGATAQSAASDAHPWIDPALLAFAKQEGSLVVYSSINEGEGLPLWKIFEAATGIRVDYVRASDTVLMSRVAIEFRADQKSWDVIQTTTVNKLPPQLLASFDPP